jgi:polar amino acid transport system substrate-binding protein
MRGEKETTMKMGIVLLAVVSGVVLSGCASSGRLGRVDADPSLLRVGVAANYPPIIYKQGKSIVGLEAELAERVAADLGKSVRFVESDWENLVTDLEAGKFDIIMSGMSITRARQMRLAFSYPYLTISQMAMVERRHRQQYISSVSILRHSGKVGVVASTTGAYLAESQFMNAEIVTYSNSEKGIKALGKGKIDIFIHDAPHVLWLESQHEMAGLVSLPYVLTQEPLAWAMRKQDHATVEKINASLSRWYKDGSLDKAIKNWISAY